MRPLPVLILALAVALFGALPARAAGFDGKWIADIPGQSGCNFNGVMTLMVTGDAIIGEVRNSAGTTVTVAHLRGRMDPDGDATFVVNGRYEGTMKFDGDRFDATWNNSQCYRHAQGDRAPTLEQEQALLAARKQHQALYDSLLARAKVDDKSLDYGQLRAESVYAETWEFYDSRAGGLVDEAASLVKGKDCVTGLQRLDQAIKYDFVDDRAHALKAECLRQLGRSDEARVEQDIAEGLTRSMMASAAGNHTFLRALTGGDGAQVDAAYVVTTYREEMEILARREIQLKYRQTEIRGSDGRYYDLVKAIAIRGGFGITIEPKNVYFDVTSFVQGRASKRAAHDVAVAQIQ